MRKNSLIKNKLLLLGFFGAFLLVPAFSQNSFSRGEELFMQNKPGEALEFLEAAISEDPAHVQAFIYLGIAYSQLDRLDDAISIYRRILPRGGAQTSRIAFNLGNAYFAKGNSDQAREYYTQAIDADPSYSAAYLNRANMLVQTGSLNEAIADYELYLTLEPRTPQRPRIEELIDFIREEFAAEERRRIQAETAARLEMDRRQRLLEEVSASLQAAADDSKSLSAGNEDIQGYAGEFELE